MVRQKKIVFKKEFGIWYASIGHYTMIISHVNNNNLTKEENTNPDPKKVYPWEISIYGSNSYVDKLNIESSLNEAKMVSKSLLKALILDTYTCLLHNDEIPYFWKHVIKNRNKEKVD